MLNFFNAGMVVAQGTVEEVKKDIPELEIAANKDNTAQVTEEESEHAEADDDLAEAEQLHEAVDAFLSKLMQSISCLVPQSWCFY
jgi:TATA-binding protein-associated factor Taf7